VVLEPHHGGPAVLLESVRRHRAPAAPSSEPAAGVRYAPHAGTPGVDLGARIGAVYGALGVIQVATAAAALADGTTAEATCGSPDDGYASVRLHGVAPAIAPAMEPA
jgi:hypothetical protein